MGGFRGYNTDFAGSQSATDRSACEECCGESSNRLKPDVLAQESVEDLKATVEQFREIGADLDAQQDDE